MKRGAVLLLSLVLLLPLILEAQNKPFMRFDEDKGLANIKVKSIFKDNEGYLWIGTENGLSKYDGYKFTNFRKDNGLPGNRIWALASDGKRLYAGCYKDGLAVIENNKVAKVYHLNSRFPNSIRRLYYSKYFRLLIIGSDNGICLFRDSTYYELACHKDSTNKASVLSIFEYKGSIYFTSHSMLLGGGLFKLNINTRNPSLSLVQRVEKISGNKFSLCVVNDTLYTSAYGEIFIYPLKKINEKPSVCYAKTQFLPWVASPVSNQEIWYGGYGESVFVSELMIFNTHTREFTKAPYDIEPQSINDLLYDKESEIMWVCSDNGLFALQKKPFEIQKFDAITSLVDVGGHNGEVYFLSKNGIYVFRNGKYTLKYSLAMIGGVIHKLRNLLYVGEDAKAVKLFKILDNNLLRFTYDENHLFLVTTRGSISLPDFSLYHPFDSRNFAADSKGGSYFVGDYDKLRYFPSINRNLKSVLVEGGKGPVSDIVKTLRVGEVFYFCSFYNGLYAVKNNKVYYLNESNSDIDNYLTDVDTTRSGEVWCTSSYGNLFHIGFTDKLFVNQKLNEQNAGIVGENYKWLKFNDCNLYVGSNKGLSIIPVSELHKYRIDSVHFYNAANGYDFVSAGSPFSDSQGNIYVHTSGKLIKIKNTRYTPEVSKLSFQDVVINGQPVSFTKLAGKTLPYTTREIALEISVLRYPSSGNISYRFSVNQGVWNTGSKVVLQSLKSGEYTVDFEAKDRESNLLYRQQVRFKIALPYWQQWWFVVCSILLITMAILLFLRWRTLKIRQQQDEKTSLLMRNTDLQMRSLQVQMNPHFIFNSLNSIQNFILSSNINDAVMYLGYLGGIIRTNLENVTEEYIHLEEEVKFLGKYIEIEKMRFKEKLDIRMVNVITDQSVLIPPMLVQPIIENAIKHGVRNLGQNGLIEVTFTIKNELLQVTVEDNGVGRKQAKLMNSPGHKSKGLALTLQRLALMNEKNKTIDNKLSIFDLYESGIPTGTRVLVTLQVVRAR